MKYFLPDASDLVDPTFDFVKETRSPTRVRQRDDLYVHEIFDAAPINGYLVSKAIVDGSGGGAGRYTLAQRQRLYREGVRCFLRLEGHETGDALETMGDCGAFSYAKEKEPPFTVQSVIDFYADCGFDYGLSVDHVILAYREEIDGGLPGVNIPPPEWSERQDLTIALASDFKRLHKEQKHKFKPMGVAQGWSPASYAHSVSELQKIGYRYIAVGGVVPLKTNEILASLAAINDIRRKDVKLHLLGVTRTSEVLTFERYGVASFDSTSPLRQAFKDDTDNFYTMDGTYPALRVPQSEGNPKLQRKISSGEIEQDRVRVLEKECLKKINLYDQSGCKAEDLLGVLCEYETLCSGKPAKEDAYRSVLEDRPWEQCDCAICKDLGIHVIVFRGAERNRRRGFHNIHVFYRRLHRELQR